MFPSADCGRASVDPARFDQVADARSDDEAPQVRVVVGRIGRPHGVRGEVVVRLMTDEPERRFAIGAVLVAGPPVDRPLTVERLRWSGRQLVVGFTGSGNRESAVALRGAILEIDVPAGERPSGGEDEFFDRDLIGLTVVDDRASVIIGVVREVLHLPGQDLLVVRDGDAAPETLIPFVAEMVTAVDLERREIRVSLPDGLVAGTEGEDPPSGSRSK